MLKNFLKVALRNLLKRKTYTLINILGLASGMAVCLLIVLFVQSELGYDKHHKQADNIYRIALDRKYPGRVSSYSIIPQSIGMAVKTEFPEVRESMRIFNFGGVFFFRIGDKTFEEEHAMAADSNFFRVFSSKALKGDPVTALFRPNTVVVNETTAKKLFGSAEGAINKTFEADGPNNTKIVHEITAVVADWPENSHFRFNMLLTTAGLDFVQQPNFINFSAHTYLLLNPEASASALEAKFPEIIKKYVAGHVQREFGQSIEDFQKGGNGYHYFLQPLKKIHLTSDLEAELEPNGSLTAVYIFSVVAIFILFLACINFINLSTARSLERAKEVGIRKTFGSERKALIGQFLLESVVVSLISILVAFGLMALLLPVFNQLSGRELTGGFFIEPIRLLFLFLFAIGIGMIAGIYPAFVLSSFRPILVLKGKFKSQRSGLILRNGLVVFQFAISVILIISTIIVNRQMNYMMSNKLGFNKDHVIIVEGTGVLDDRSGAFKTELSKIAGVEIVSGTSAMPGQGNFFGNTYKEVGSKEQVTGRGIIADENYDKVLGLELKEGRFFSKNFGTDSLAVVLNEKAVADFGLKHPVGTRLTTPDNFLNAPDGTPYIYTVIGVVKDFHFQSLHEKISPVVINYSGKFRDVSAITALRIQGGHFKDALVSTEKTWKHFVKDRPFHFEFLDQTLAKQYNKEQSTQKIFTIFSTLAIFIACIGLLGLAAYSTQQRIHEIGIRKVLGATTGNIVGMLSKDFVKLVLASAVIAFPVAWWFMKKWLDDFAYRIDMSVWIFIGAAGAALLVALFTISFQAIKAAIANPVKSLRTE
jgi:putative ABC transport system permease protein